uniref:Cytochrome b-c1 complex subunit 2, mitochondrial n=1 Tax=Gadus morhua TaxID=8049 RepID=A0A8C5CJQ1_GADMO
TTCNTILCLDFQTRLYAAQAARKLEATEHVSFQPQEVQVTKLPSGLVIASLENYSPVSKIGVFVKAGCRHESHDNVGVTHILRLASNLTTKGASAFKICRGIEAVGGHLSVTSTRENMAYSVDCLRDDVDTVMEYLINVTTAQEFRPWEVSALTPNVRRDVDDAADSLVELLHQAAYKNALSNSLYCPEFMVGHIQSEHLHQFVQNNFTSARMALVGLGVEHSVLKQVGEQFLNIRSGAGASGGQAQYRGGEMRQQARGSMVHCAVVSESVAAGSPDALAFSVLQHVLGAAPHIKRGSNTTNKLVQGINKATSLPFEVEIGLLFKNKHKNNLSFPSSLQVIRAAVAQVKAVADGDVTAADLTRAKTQLKSQQLMSLETSEGFLEALGSQALASGAYLSTDAAAKNIDNVSLTDVANAAKMFVSGKKTMASVGNLGSTPFVDEL